MAFTIPNQGGLTYTDQAAHCLLIVIFGASDLTEVRSG